MTHLRGVGAPHQGSTSHRKTKWLGELLTALSRTFIDISLITKSAEYINSIKWPRVYLQNRMQQCNSTHVGSIYSATVRSSACTALHIHTYTHTYSATETHAVDVARERFCTDAGNQGQILQRRRTARFSFAATSTLPDRQATM